MPDSGMKFAFWILISCSIVSLEELEELYEGMIGQSELPPLAFRESETFPCSLSPQGSPKGTQN